MFYSLIFSYYFRVPLNSDWRTTGGTRTIVLKPLIYTVNPRPKRGKFLESGALGESSLDELSIM
jgi:hypothetical protein